CVFNRMLRLSTALSISQFSLPGAYLLSVGYTDSCESFTTASGTTWFTASGTTWITAVQCSSNAGSNSSFYAGSLHSETIRREHLDEPGQRNRILGTRTFATIRMKFLR